jgi:hypothetical protein
MNYIWRPGGTGLWIWMWTWLGNPSETLVVFVPPVSIKDCPLHGPWSSHRLFISSTYLLMRTGRLVTLLSWVPALFGPTVRGEK